MSNCIKCVIVLLSMVSAVVVADEFDRGIDAEEDYDHSGWFVGFKAGQMSQSLQRDDSDASGVVEHSSGLGGIYWGYNFTDWFGLEMDINVASSANETLFEETSSAIFYSMALSPKFTYQLNDSIGVYVKAGLYAASYTAWIRDDSYWYSDTVIEDWSGYGMAAGTGLQLSLSESINMRLSYEYGSVNMDDTDEDEAAPNPRFDAATHAYSVGFHYQF